MDTRSKKYHKIAVVIILLTVLLPALFLVGLYPQMEKAMMDLKEGYDKEYEIIKKEQEKNASEWALVNNFINRAVEANYCLYGEMLEEATGTDVNWSAIDEWGWREDYEAVIDRTEYNAILKSINSDGDLQTTGRTNSNGLPTDIGSLKFVYDSEGNCTVTLSGDINWNYYSYEGYDKLDPIVQESVEQYERNAAAYEEIYGVHVDSNELKPKNFEVEYAFIQEGVGDYIISGDEIYNETDWEYYYHISPENLFIETGSFLVLIPIAAFVAIVALFLPCIHCLETGKEKIFSFPMEIMIVVAACVIAGAAGMGHAMMYTNMYALEQIGFPPIMGYEISTKDVYILCIVGNMIGWALVFFGVYMVVTNLRQFLFGMKGYLKHQSFLGKIFGWIKRKFVKFYRYLTNIDFKDDMNKGILKIVLINFVVLTVLCCLWFFGVAGLVIYSIALFWLLQKVGKKWQAQYDSVLHATEQMASGDLRISLEDDLGIFEPMGTSLKQVQEGFKKAVVEEAKSQSMKSELITNVSHDLKTPLTAIITYVDLLKKEDITEDERKSYISTLDQKSQRLKALIEDLFEVSKANSGNVKMNFVDINVVSLLRQVRSEMDEEIQKSNLQFRWNLPEEKVILPLDGQRMYRVFENLIRNALKYSMPYSRVYVDLLANETEVQIIFRNMSATEMNYDPEQLTERFVRGDVSRNSEGSGLGLAIVKSFVELQNGSFKIEVDGDLFKAIISFQK